MNWMYVIYFVLGMIAMLFVFFIWSCFVISSRADEQIERMYVDELKGSGKVRTDFTGPSKAVGE